MSLTELDSSELASVLAGLRLLQDELIEHGPEAVKKTLPQFYAIEPLNVDSIDVLCDKINR